MVLSALIVVTTMFPAASAQGVTLQSCAPNTTYAYEQGGTSNGVVPAFVTFTFTINNPGGWTNVGLGITLTDPSGRPWNDVSNDIVVQIPPGTSQSSRNFVYYLPTNGGGPGSWTAYSATCAIWSGQPGYSTWWDSNYQNPVTIYVSSGF